MKQWSPAGWERRWGYPKRLPTAAGVLSCILPIGVNARGSNGLTAMPWRHVQPLILDLGVNAICCLALVPRRRLLGAILGWLLAALYQILLAVAVQWRHVQTPAKIAVPTAASRR
jgi:hypothetical protein